MNFRCLWLICVGWTCFASAHAQAGEPFELPEVDGYRGIWYSNQETHDEYVYKYSGGMATYPQQHAPIAIYAEAVNKTFFVYGGTETTRQRLLHMVSYYDHATGTVPRPRILLDKQTIDAHDNPTLSIDGDGYLWIFSNAHGTARDSYIHRSAQPFAIDRFERVATTNFSYSQPWYVPGQGFLFLHTRYVSGMRRLFWMTSAEGRDWSEPQPLAQVALGHYQISTAERGRVATALNYHPRPGGLNARTNLYYLETSDFGHSWQTAGGEPVILPLREAKNPALVRDYQDEGRLVYLKDVRLDERGRPVILHLVSRGYAPGPANDPRTWRIARWDGAAWSFHDVTTSDHNYDFGSLDLGADGTWTLVAPTEPGPQPYGTGGQMVLWTSGDRGATWHRMKQLTHADDCNHSYARRPIGARDDFFALWADGDARKPSPSRLYYTDRAGTHVWQLPEPMTAPEARPEIRW
ncbi:MAG: BNR repeat-containing protein [Pirellulales bacterium]|nr:BNR repeat-containing protein [Pirellulales bacterium]